MKKMSKEVINKELVAITKQLLIESGTPFKYEIKLDASLQRHLNIDSLGRAELFERIEKFFDVSVPDSLLASAETLNDVADYLLQATPGVKSIYQPTLHIPPENEVKIDADLAKTLTEVVRLFGELAPNKAHIYFQTESGTEEVITYGELLQSSLRVAASLRRMGVQDGETVAIMLPTTPGFFYSFLGTMFAGGVPVPIYPPFRMHMLEAYAKTESHILNNAEVRVLITFSAAEKLSLLLQNFVPSLKYVTNVESLLKSEPLDKCASLKKTSFGFIQYTSGSTANPKGVLLTHENLLANIRAYGKRIKASPDDVAVSWLPLYHDLGLIGMWLGSLYHGAPLILLTPFTFLNHPDRWLWAIHYHRGTISGAPNFAYELCIRKIKPEQIEGLDLSSLRIAANGAEKVYPKTLEDFARKFASYGFNPKSLMPVYGLAESTVGLAVPEPGEGYRVDYVDRKKFEELRLAETVEKKQVGLEFISCGKPLVDHEIRIVDDKIKVLPERNVGRVQFRGPSNMQGYYHNPKATAEIYYDGWFDSGDLGYLADGEVYITGRRKDLIIKAGRNIYPAEIEEVVGNLKGIRQGCVVAFASTNKKEGTEDLVVVAETREKNIEVKAKIEADISNAIASVLEIVPDQIILVKPHTVLKTSSGKLQRAAVKKMYEDNNLFKRHTPPWFQIVRLALASAAQKTSEVLKKAAAFLYTMYMVIILIITFIPLYILVRLFPADNAQKLCRNWAKLVTTITFCPVHVMNKEKLKQDRAVIFASNHASYADAVIILTFAPDNTKFVVKKELLKVPLLGGVIKKLDALPVDRLDMPKGLADAKHFLKVLKEGKNVFIFPEGTFGYASGLRPFKLGAFKVAVEGDIPIIPIGINSTRHILRANEYLFKPHALTVTACDPIYPEGIEWQQVTQLRDKTRAEIAKYCGEPTLDFIVAQTVAPGRES